MKKVTLLIAIVIATTSCKKCWECTTTVDQTLNGQPYASTAVTQETCEKDTKQAWEDTDGTIETPIAPGNVLVTTTKTECVKQ